MDRAARGLLSVKQGETYWIGINTMYSNGIDQSTYLGAVE